MFVDRLKNSFRNATKLTKIMELSRKIFVLPLNLTKEGMIRNKFWLRNIVNYIFFEIQYKNKEYGCLANGCMR